VTASHLSSFNDTGVFDESACASFLFRELEQLSFDGVGVTRESYGASEEAAHRFVQMVAERHGLEVEIDDALNLFVTLPGLASAESFILCGSHLDSVPHGGNFDGAAGVVAALICLCKMRSLGIIPNITIKLVVLRAEESAWFGKPCIGSSALLGQLSAADLQLRHSVSDRTLAESMTAAGANTERIALSLPLIDLGSVLAYFELHIEQGPVLVSENLPVAIVSGIRGSIRHRHIVCSGEAGHSGAVPQTLRHDAVLATADLLMRAERRSLELLDNGQDLVMTSGVITTNPDEHAITRIPGEVVFSLDIRSQNAQTLNAFHQFVLDESQCVGLNRGVAFRFDPPTRFNSALLDASLVQRLKRLSLSLDLNTPIMPSGAGHDAAIFSAQNIPSAMIFVRNDHGSHNPGEAMEIEDFLKATHLLYEALLEAA
jgi:beta-ureidopropionase / N-carbamoyl-L-amino-acid hydrolase